MHVLPAVHFTAGGTNAICAGRSHLKNLKRLHGLLIALRQGDFGVKAGIGISPKKKLKLASGEAN